MLSSVIRELGLEDMLSKHLDCKDVHLLKAAQMFNKDPKDVIAEERRLAKVANYMVLYNTSATEAEKIVRRSTTP